MKNILGKVTVKLLSCLLALSIFFLTTACFGVGKDSDSDNTLEYYCWTAGYGIEWIEAMIDDFGSLDWVKEKYPKFKAKPNYNDVQAFTSNRIPLGKSNTIDLFFGNLALGLHGSSYVADLTDSLYNSQVPGESVTVGEKLLKSVRDVIGTKDSDDPDAEVRYYHMPWSMSFGGIIYNETIFSKLGLQVPCTTDELFTMMDKVKALNGSNSAYPYTTSIISSKITYADYLFPVWWAQYEGIEQYQNFFQAIDYDGVRGSAEVLKQTGRLRSLEIFEKMYAKSNGYFDRTSFNYEFKQGQVRLIRGQGLMMINGDWFSNEMKVQMAQHAENGYDYTIGAMKTPIISKIIEKTPSIKSDAVLSKVVAEVDAGKTSSETEGVTQKDFDIIREARGITFANLQGATTYVPEYASAKELAIDFLRYMATDRANAIYAKNTTGARLPFEFNLKESAPDVYKEMGKSYEVQKDFQEMLDFPTFWAIPEYNTYDIVSKGGLRVFGEYSELEKRFVGDDTLTAEKIMKNISAYYAYEGGYRWDKVIGDAGL